jgi:hypothetical protein
LYFENTCYGQRSNISTSSNSSAQVEVGNNAVRLTAALIQSAKMKKRKVTEVPSMTIQLLKQQQQQHQQRLTQKQQQQEQEQQQKMKKRVCVEKNQRAVA